MDYDFDPEELTNFAGGDKDDFFRTCYAKVILNPDILLKNRDYDVEVKINSIEALIRYFEEIEEFEKCGDLKKIQRLQTALKEWKDKNKEITKSLNERKRFTKPSVKKRQQKLKAIYKQSIISKLSKD